MAGGGDARELSGRLADQAAALVGLLDTDSPDPIAVETALVAARSTVTELETTVAVAMAGSGPQPLPPVVVSAPVLGVDACRDGWVGAILEPGTPRPRIAVAERVDVLVETVRRSLAIQVVAI
ncbi:MAG TPA: hypothetical protein VFM86_01850, partial [Pedococcus sp.]|nr:hypothetical protein [Pedococcus sp.]